MPKLLMITGLGGGRDLALGKKGAFYNTLEEFHKYWERIDIVLPHIKNVNHEVNVFGNIYLHISPWPLVFHPVWFLWKCNKIYREQKFNLITVHEFPPFYNGIGARLLWHKIKVPYVLEIMHIPGYPKAGNFREKIYKWLMQVFIAIDSGKAVAVRVINKKETPEFLVQAGVPKHKLKYIPAFYIDLDVFKPLDTPKEYDLVFAARLEQNKGIYQLLQPISKAKTQMPNLKLLVVGQGSERKNLESKIKTLGLRKNVVFSGWLEGPQDVAKAYNSAKCFINPSYNEGGPRVVLEAMACGLPVITTQVGLMHDIIQNGQNGLFTGWEPAEMADRILNLLNDQELQYKFSFAGKELVKEFERKAAIKNYADKLKSLL